MKILQICLIEDDSVDAENFMRILQKTGLIYQLHHVDDGKKAIFKLTELLQNKAFPLLIALDLKIPLVSGIEILGFLKKRFPSMKYDIIITTTSDAPDDLKILYDYKINAYFLKARLYKDLPLYIFKKYLSKFIRGAHA